MADGVRAGRTLIAGTFRTRRRAVRPATSPAGPPDSGYRQTAGVLDDLDDTIAPAETLDDDAVEEPAPSIAPTGSPRPQLDLLIWDAPNIDMTLSTVIGARPTAASRPRFDAIAAWFVDAAGDPETPDAPEVEACVFANIPPSVGSLQRWVEALRGFGFAVFARPKTAPDDDIDQAMLDHIDVRRHSHRLRRLVVFSGDGRNFAEPLEELSRSGVQVVVVAFSEVAGYAIGSDLIEFIDIEDVPGAFAVPLDRVRLDALPPEGAWLRPTRSLRDFVSSYTARRTGS
jgi:putative heme uptake system protein